MRNYAYIDDANLYYGVSRLGWRLDYVKFRIWLRDKHKVVKAYIFVGYIGSFHDRYAELESIGFSIIFKETTHGRRGMIKGNCDAELVLQAVHDMHMKRFDQAVIVSSDGDFACLVAFLLNRKRLRAILSPSNKCSILLMRTSAPITYMNEIKTHVSKNEKAPDEDETS